MREDESPVLFVSHHSSKLEVAEHVERALAARGVRCWIAPHNVEPGESFDRVVHKAIGDTDAMLLLFCSQSEKSRHVKRELILADQQGKAIIPLRLERIDPGALSYHLADSQWIDWLERRDDVMDRIAAKAREFRHEGHAAADASVIRPLGERPAATPADGSMPASGDEATRPDAAPSHSAAVGAAADLNPHAPGAFAGPGAAAQGPGAPGYGAGSHGYAGPPPARPAGGGGRSNLKWIWAGLGAAIVVGAIVLAIMLSSRGSGSAPGAVADSSETTAPAIQGDGQPITAEWFAGVWADTRDCREPFRFDHSGQVTFPTGVQARWSIEDGNVLAVELNGNIQRRRLVRISDDEVRNDTSSTYRCFPGAT